MLSTKLLLLLCSPGCPGIGLKERYVAVELLQRAFDTQHHHLGGLAGCGLEGVCHCLSLLRGIEQLAEVPCLAMPAWYLKVGMETV